MGCILDFLQGALQEEAEATVESLKQNYAASMKKEKEDEQKLVLPTSSCSSPPPFATSSSQDQDRAAMTTTMVMTRSPGMDLDLQAVQQEVDGILGALGRRRRLSGSASAAAAARGTSS